MDAESSTNETERDKAIRNFILVTAASALYVAKKCSTLKEGADMAEKSIASGRALQVLQQYRQLSQVGCWVKCCGHPLSHTLSYRRKR